jgi:hypothetical protein
MAAGVEVPALFVGFVEMLFAQLAGDERVAAFGLQVAESAASAAAEDRDLLGLGGAELDAFVGRRIGSLEALAQCGARNALADAGDRQAFIIDEPVDDLEAEVLGDERVVPDGRMRVEGQVTGVEREPGLLQRGLT